MAFRALLFDFDDCLFDTAHDRIRSTLLAFHENGFPEVGYEEAARNLGKDTATRFLIGAKSEDRALGERLARLWEESNARIGYPEAKPYPGVPETLAALGPVPMGILSASQRVVIEGILRRWKLDPQFGCIVGRGEAAQKPSPDGLLRLCAELEVAPSGCLYVGDSPMDIRAGKAAGMTTLAVTYGLGRREDLERESPDGFLDRFEDLLGFVRGKE